MELPESVQLTEDWGSTTEPREEAGRMMSIGDVRRIRALIGHVLRGTRRALVLLPNSLPILTANGIPRLSSHLCISHKPIFIFVQLALRLSLL